VNESAERIYARLEPIDVGDDTLKHIAEALGLGAVEVDEVAPGTDTHGPWARIMDPYACPVWALPYLAQWVGERLLPSDSEQDKRDRIAQAAGFYSGTDRAMREEVARTLTGTRTVTVLTRVGGDRWAMTVKVKTSECPSPVASEAAARRQKPAGVVLTFLVSDEPIIDEGGAARTVDGVGATITVDAVTAADIA
jgi:hypothetical protein